MTAITMLDDKSIDYRLLLMAHMVCADQQIHSEESRALHELAEQVHASQRSIEEIEKILAQDKTQVSFEDAARRLQPNQHSEAMQQILAIAYVDGFFSPLEREMVERIAKIFGCSDCLQSLIEAAEDSQSERSANASDEPTVLSLGAAFLKGAESVLSRTLIQKLVQIAPENIGRKIEHLQREILLAGPEYDVVIQQCAAIAREDYKFAELSLNRTLEILDQLRKNIQRALIDVQRQANGKGKAESAKEIAEQFEDTRSNTSDKIKEGESRRNGVFRSLDGI